MYNVNPLLTSIFPQAQMVRRVKAYLKSMKVITDEEELHRMSQEVEPPSGGLAPAPLPVLNTACPDQTYHLILSSYLIILSYHLILSSYLIILSHHLILSSQQSGHTD